LDNVVQAAGRCNREGRLEVGHVFVYRAPSAPPVGTLRKALEVTTAMLAESNSTLDLNDPQVFDTYFRRLYMTEEPDKYGIQTLPKDFQFGRAPHNFRLIENEGNHPVLVPSPDALKERAELRSGGPTRDKLRRVKLFTFQPPRRDHEQLL